MQGSYAVTEHSKRCSILPMLANTIAYDTKAAELAVKQRGSILSVSVVFCITCRITGRSSIAITSSHYCLWGVSIESHVCLSWRRKPLRHTVQPGNGLHTFTETHRLTRSSFLRGTINWVPAFGWLVIKIAMMGVYWCRLLQHTGELTAQVGWLSLRVGGRIRQIHPGEGNTACSCPTCNFYYQCLIILC